MMRKILVLLFLSLLLLSCERQKMAKELKSLMKETISIPEDLQMILPSGVVLDYIKSTKSLMILFFDSLSCSSCQLSQMSRYDDLYRLADSTQSFRVMAIFSPKKSESDNFVQNICNSYFRFPLYWDKSGSFCKMNGFIPEDSRFHSFLIDSTGAILFVGNPMASEGLWNLLIEKIEPNN